MKKYLQAEFSTRQYMLSRDFEIFYYNDRHISPLGEHTHDYYEFYFFLGGEVSITIGGKTTVLQKQDMILIPPGVSHHVNILNPDAPYQRFIFWITAEYCSQLTAISPDYGYVMEYAGETKQYIYHYDEITFNALQSKIFQLLEEIHFEHFGKEAKISLCVNDLILHLNRTVYEMVTPAASAPRRDLYEQLIDYIERHLEENLTLERLAKEFYVNKYHISHLFKERHGLSLHQYIIKKRLALCVDALLGGREITDSCLLFGFSDYSSFYRAFKKEYGISPSKYKERFLLK